MSIAKIITNTGVTVFVQGHTPFTMSREHKLFNELLDAIADKDIELILDIQTSANRVEQYAKGKLSVVDGEIFYDGESLHGALIDRILDMMDEEEDAEYLLKFLSNLMENPSKQSRQELYLFLEACDLPITENGTFVAYKWVRDDYKDVHSASIDNSVGQTISMLRRNVNDDRQVTCSTGLHVCSSAYDKFGARLMLVEVNPANVISVPYDYNNSKMRVCEYTVIQELPVESYGNGFNTPIYRQA